MKTDATNTTQAPLPRHYTGYAELLGGLNDLIDAAEDKRLASALVMNAAIIAAHHVLGGAAVAGFLQQALANLPEADAKLRDRLV